MDERRPPVEPAEPDEGPYGAIEGADPAALGITPPPQPPSPAAQVDDSEELVPGAIFGDLLPDEPKPWFTSLAAESDQAGVANDHSEEQARHFPYGDDEALEDEDAP
jgi:hypothetical protein